MKHLLRASPYALGQGWFGNWLFRGEVIWFWIKEWSE